MTDAVLVLRKVARLREYLRRARERRPEAAAELACDLVLQDALAMTLLVATQEALDLCFHIVADEGWGVPGTYVEGFALLAQHRVISTKTASELSQIVALRNRLAHGYASVDHARLWAELPSGLQTLEGYANAIARHVDR